MKETLLYLVAISMVLAVSCKENLDAIVVATDTNASDTFYIEAVETAQKRRIYIEELTGVTCINCPAGAEELHKLSTVDYPGQLSVIAFHAGTSFTTPLPQSKYNFTTPDGDQLWQNVWGPGDSKPSAVIDRIRALSTGNNTANTIYNNGKGTWKPAIEKDRTLYQTTPLNIYLTSTFNSEKDRYDIDVKVKYTETVKYANALHIFVAQDSIVDAQLMPGEGNIKEDYVFNHVFRKAITNVITGKVILPELATKSPGLVYEYRTSISVDPINEASQKGWIADNMHVTAFVTVADNPGDIHVVQVQEVRLKN